MRKIRLAKLISLGQTARYLFDVEPNWRIHGSSALVNNMDVLIAGLTSLKFKVTLAAADDLLGFAEELRTTPPGARISVIKSKRLHKIMEKLRHTLRAEARTLNAYVLNEKRFDVLKLVADPGSFFAAGTFGKLPRIAQLDIREAGKCIGFELPTAGAFHLLRATEDCLRSYYKAFFKRAKMDNALWGPLVSNLRAKSRKPKPSETLLNHLDHIRKNFRNPTDHPDMVYDMDGVQDLFALVVDVLNRMAKELPEKPSEDIDLILKRLDELGAESDLLSGSEATLETILLADSDTDNALPRENGSDSAPLSGEVEAEETPAETKPNKMTPS
jgi:hypothetical protein